MATAKRKPRAAAARRPKPHDERLLGLATWIISQEAPVTRGEIYARFAAHYRGRAETREKMFTRDKEALRQLGFHLETVDVGGDAQKGYVIDPHASLLPRLELAADEAAAAWTAGVAALGRSSHPLRTELESALRKLVVGTRALPPRAAATEELAAAAAAGGGAGGDGHLARLSDAWERRLRLRIGYYRVAGDETVEREVDVYGWARRRGEWIFVGHCHLRNAVRIFYLSRVRAMRLARVPGELLRRRAQQGKDGHYDIPADFDVRRWSRQEIWDYDVHPPAEAVVRFTGSLAGLARQLLPGARHATDAAGARVATLAVRNLRGLVRQALAWGPEAEVRAPPEARAMAVEILDAALPGPGWGTP